MRITTEAKGTVQEVSTTATNNGSKSTRALITLITPGDGSSGSYTPEVLKRAAEDKVFPRGTQGHIDHDTMRERQERPAGSLRNLALVLEQDAYWDGQALVAESLITSAWSDFILEVKDYIGVSINASAEVKEVRENGTVTTVVERLLPHPFNRADLVTIAGRGGRITEVLESARAIESRTLNVEEATASDVRMWLSASVRDMHATRDEWAYVEDHDDQYVYYTTSDRMMRRSYSLDGVNVTLGDDAVQVRRRVEYDPINTNTPSIPAGITENKEDANMATIDDAELQTLREAASRVTQAEQALETERAERKAEQEEQAKQVRESRVATATSLIQSVFGEDAPEFLTESAQLSAQSDQFDPEAFEKKVREAHAKFQSQSGAGVPSGVGYTSSSSDAVKEFTQEAADAEIASAFGRTTVKEA